MVATNRRLVLQSFKWCCQLVYVVATYPTSAATAAWYLAWFYLQSKVKWRIRALCQQIGYLIIIICAQKDDLRYQRRLCAGSIIAICLCQEPHDRNLGRETKISGKLERSSSFIVHWNILKSCTIAWIVFVAEHAIYTVKIAHDFITAHAPTAFTCPNHLVWVNFQLACVKSVQSSVSDGSQSVREEDYDWQCLISLQAIKLCKVGSTLVSIPYMSEYVYFALILSSVQEGWSVVIYILIYIKHIYLYNCNLWNMCNWMGLFMTSFSWNLIEPKAVPWIRLVLDARYCCKLLVVSDLSDLCICSFAGCS